MKTMHALLFILLLFSCHFASAAERVLAQTRGEPAFTLLETGAASGPALVLKTGSFTLPLESEALKEINGLHPEMPLQATIGSLGETPAACVSFGLTDGHGGIRSFAIVFVQEAGAWRAAKQWTADCGPLGELGFTREKQSVSFDGKNAVSREARNTRMEGVVHKLDCGCLTCGSRMLETVEQAAWVWNAATKTLERAKYERRYIVQDGEGVMSVARKALGDARLIARIYKLNPEIKQESTLKPGQQVLVERQ